MTAKITFFPVDNGDMTLLKLADNKTTLLIDCKIRTAADDPNETVCDVAKELRSRLSLNQDNRPYVDGFLLSHPDQDHCLGLEKHFWLGSVSDYPDDDKPSHEKRIIINELWSSPMVFRRFIKEPLCDDAKAFRKEAKRRLKSNVFHNFSPEGDRILILGEDKDGKTDKYEHLVVRPGDTHQGVNKSAHTYLSWKLIGPMPVQGDEGEELLSKNASSVIINFSVVNNPFYQDRSSFLTGGDAGVAIWEKVWSCFTPVDLQYDLLLAPHHCSWRSLSHDSWSDNGEDAVVSEGARSALSQCKQGAIIISSSKPVVDDKNDPPCIRAKREYKSILGRSGHFKCTGEEPNKTRPKPLEIETTTSGFKVVKTVVGLLAGAAASTQARAG